MIQLYMSLIDDEQDKLRFEIAYYKYRNLLHYKARSILKDEHRAEDAVQEVFMRIADRTVRREAVVDAAVLPVPRLRQRG